MPHITTDRLLSYTPNGRHSFTITPQMGVVKHFPTDVAKALIEMGATDVTPRRKASKEAQAEPAD